MAEFGSLSGMRLEVIAITFLVASFAVTIFWWYLNSDARHLAALHFLLNGDWKVTLRSEEPGSRHPHGESFGLAYRVSAYRGGQYLGCYLRFGDFEPLVPGRSERLPDLHQMKTAINVLHGAPLVAILLFVSGLVAGGYWIYRTQLKKRST